MSQQLLFFFSALGAFNGLLVGFYFLFFAKPKHLSNTFLGALFLALSVRVGKSVFFYFYDSIADAYIQFGLFACWLIGPFLFYYVRSAIAPNPSLKKEASVAIGALAGLSIAVNLIFSWSLYLDLWGYFVKIIYLQWLFFVILSGWVLHNNRKSWFFKSKNRPFKIWLSSIFFGNLIICVAFNTGNYTSYIVGALSFSFVFYALILLLLFYKRRDELIYLETKKYQSNKLDAAEARAIRDQLEQFIKKDRLFLDSNLSLKKVSELLKVSPLKVSQTLNEYCNTNFNDYINTFRIGAAMKMIVTQKDYTFEAIAMDCGFNSKSTFYTAFKKQTGMTPLNFRKEKVGGEKF